MRPTGADTRVLSSRPSHPRK